MTATRWWVRRAARWLARFKTTEGQLRSLSLAVTGFSTFSLVLQNAGFGRLVPYVGVISVVVWIAYTYLYAEGGVHNQMNRDMTDLSRNFAHPAQRIDDELIGRGVAAATRGEPLSEVEREAVRAELDAAWREYRDGIDVERIERETQEVSTCD